MSNSDKVFADSIPDFYDDYMVPLIFEPYALDMARRVADRKPRSILETAAGSGVVTRALAPFLAADSVYTVTDLNQPMLNRAARRHPPDDRITFRQADAMALPFNDGTFDAVCCQFGAMFFPDKVHAFKEARRMLREKGTFLFNVWDRIEENEFAASVTDTVSRLYPDDPPVFLRRTPHGYHDVDIIEGDLRAAGFTRIEVYTITEWSRAESPRIPAMAYCQGTPLRNELEARETGALEKITDLAAGDIGARHGDGAVSGKIQGHVFAASG